MTEVYLLSDHEGYGYGQCPDSPIAVCASLELAQARAVADVDRYRAFMTQARPVTIEWRDRYEEDDDESSDTGTLWGRTVTPSGNGRQYVIHRFELVER